MSDPKRIVDTSGDEARALVQAARQDAPDPALEARVVGALAAAPFAARASSGRWMATTGLAIAVGVAALSWGLRDRSPKVAPPARAIASAPSPAPVVAAAEPATISAEALPDSPPEPEKPATGLAVGRAAPSAPAPAASSSAKEDAVATTKRSLEREIKLLDGVKRHLDDGAPEGAAAELTVYELEFPSGALRREADVLRIRLELARGNRELARKLGDEFLAREPNGVHAKRIRALFVTP